MKLAGSVLLWVCIYFGITQAQKVTISDLLHTAEKDVSVEVQTEKVSVLEESSKNMPLIDDIEVRIRNEAFEFDAQRYSLRVEPRGFGETKAGKKFV